MGGQVVYVGRLHMRSTETTEIPIALIVGKDDNEVGRIVPQLFNGLTTQEPIAQQAEKQVIAC